MLSFLGEFPTPSLASPQELISVHSLGALHWGMEFAGYGGQKGYSRLMLGAAPVLFAWPTLMLQPTMALVTQWAGFTALWWADSTVTTLGWSMFLIAQTNPLRIMYV